MRVIAVVVVLCLGGLALTAMAITTQRNDANVIAEVRPAAEPVQQATSEEAPNLPDDVPSAVGDLLARFAPSVSEGFNVRAVEYTETIRPDLNPVRPLSDEYEPIVFGSELRVMAHLDLIWEYEAFVGAAAEEMTGPRPVIVLFHGAGRTALSMIDMWEHTANAEGLILLSLQSQDDAWPSAAIGGLVNAMLDHAERDYAIDRDRVFLFGHSSGGKFAQRLANQVPGPWQAVGVHAGSLGLAELRPTITPTPIRHYLGDQDATFGLEAGRLVGEALVEAGHPFEMVVIPGHTHWYYNGGLLFSADAWAWFDSL